MPLMTNALAQISSYRPSRSREEVEKKLRFFPFKLAEEVYEFYQWGGAPIGKCGGFGYCSDHDDSTYDCILESYLGGASDVIHFLSLEEAEEHYPNYSSNADIYNERCLPFILSENGELVIKGSDSQIEVSPVLDRENNDKLWFPSLTNMMLAITETVDTIGTIMPPSYDYINDYWVDEEKEREQWKILGDIAQKYGSRKRIIVTN